MGAQLVSQAYAFAAGRDISGNEMRLLLFMALSAMDADNPPRYFASREESAFALGRRVVDASCEDPVALADREAAFARVKVALRGLVRAGAILRVVNGRNGRRSEYALTLGRLKGSERDP